MNNLLQGLNFNVIEYQHSGQAKSLVQYLYFEFNEEKMYPIEVEGKVCLLDTNLTILMSNGDTIKYGYKEREDNVVNINDERYFVWEHSLFVEDEIPIDDGYVIKKVYEDYLTKRFKSELE